jgi:hypothetical protein
MISAADAQLVGCPLPAAVVARTESIRNCVARSAKKSRAVELGASPCVIEAIRLFS